MISIIKEKDIEFSVNNNLGNDCIQFVFGKRNQNHIHSEFLGCGKPREEDSVIKIEKQEDFEVLTDRVQMILCELCDSYPQIETKLNELGVQLHV